MAALHGSLNVHGEMTEPVNLKRLTNVSEHEKDLHVDLSTARTNGPADIMQETQIACPHIFYVGIAIGCPTIEALSVKRILGTIEGLDTSF